MHHRRDIRADIVDALDRTWDTLRYPGAVYTGHDRVAIAAVARATRAVTGTGNAPLPEPVVEAARRVATDPAGIDEAWVSRIVTSGLPVVGYVELVGVVSRVAAVDAFEATIGAPPRPLPEPSDGDPTGVVDENARPAKGFVPMTHIGGIWWALSLVPEAFAGMKLLHNRLYLSPSQMREPGSPHVLTRPQIELVASRVSELNDCFY